MGLRFCPAFTRSMLHIQNGIGLLGILLVVLCYRRWVLCGAVPCCAVLRCVLRCLIALG